MRIKPLSFLATLINPSDIVFPRGEHISHKTILLGIRKTLLILEQSSLELILKSDRILILSLEWSKGLHTVNSLRTLGLSGHQMVDNVGHGNTAEMLLNSQYYLVNLNMCCQ